MWEKLISGVLWAQGLKKWFSAPPLLYGSPVDSCRNYFSLVCFLQQGTGKFSKRNFFQHFLSLLVAHSDFYIATYMSLPGGTCPRGVYQLLSSLYTVLVSPVSHKGLYPLDSRLKYTKIPCIGFGTWFSHHNFSSAQGRNLKELVLHSVGVCSLTYTSASMLSWSHLSVMPIW